MPKSQRLLLKVLPGEDGSLPYRAVPPLDEEPPHRSVLVVPVSDAGSGPPLEGVPSGRRSCRRRYVRKESGRGKDRFNIRDVAGGRYSQAVLDFLSTTDVGRLIPAEEDAGSEVSEWELWGRREERRAEVKLLGVA